MKTKTIAIFVLIIISCGILHANSKVEVTGQVKDKNKKALEFCTVALFNQNDSLITGGVTNEKGYFSFQPGKGSYKLIISYIGYKTDTFNIDIDSKDKFLGVFILEYDAMHLDEIVVKGSTKENEIDKEVQLVTKQMRISTANTSDVLDRLQGVTFDRYNNKIKVDGDDNIIILVNGLEKDQEYIRGLSPERLKKIEIIRDPSGRYTLDGYSAVLNVILKQDYKGSEFNLEEMAYIDTDSKKKAILPINTSSLTFNYTYNKINVYAKVRNIYNYYDIVSSEKKEYDNGFVIEKKSNNGDRNTIFKYFSNKYVVGFDYNINPKHSISFESNIKDMPTETDSDNEYFDVTESENGIITENYMIHSKTLSENKKYTNSIFYNFKINNNSSLNADFTYSKYTDEFTNNIYESNGYCSDEKENNKKDYSKSHLEYIQNFNNKSSFNIGYGNTWKKLENSYISGVNLLSNSETVNESSYNFTDLRHKLYCYFSSKITKKISFKIGIAGEYSNPKVENNGKIFMIYLPHLDFNVKAHKYLDIKLKYRSHSRYPGFWQANPFSQQLDQYTTLIGNPYIKPEVTHKISLKFRAIQNAISFEPYYHYSDNLISRVVTSLGNDLFQYSYDNVGQYIRKGFKANITIPLFKRSLIIQSYLNCNINSIKYNGKTNSFNDWTMNSQIIYINKKHDITSGLIYQKNLKKIIQTHGYYSDDIDFWMLFVQKSFFKKKMNITLGYMLPVNFLTEYDQVNYTAVDGYKETKIYNTAILKNIVVFTMSYRLNKGKNIRKKDKEIELENENKSNGPF